MKCSRFPKLQNFRFEKRKVSFVYSLECGVVNTSEISIPPGADLILVVSVQLMSSRRRCLTLVLYAMSVSSSSYPRHLSQQARILVRGKTTLNTIHITNRATNPTNPPRKYSGTSREPISKMPSKIQLKTVLRARRIRRINCQ